MDESPELEFVIRSNEAERSFKAVGEALKNPKPALREFSKYLKEKLEKRLASQGDGSWPDYAPSTKARMEATGTGRVTKFGKARKAYLNKLVSYEKFLKGQAKKEKSLSGRVSEKTEDKLLILEGKIQKLRDQREKVAQKAFKKRRIRKAVAKKENMLGNLKRLKVRITDNSLRIGLLDGPDWAWRHNEGDGAIPKRQIVPDELDAEDINKLIEILEKHLIQIFENPPPQQLELLPEG